MSSAMTIGRRTVMDLRAAYSRVAVPVMSGWTVQMKVYEPGCQRRDVVDPQLDAGEDVTEERGAAGGVLDLDVVRGVRVVVEEADRERLIGRRGEARLEELDALGRERHVGRRARGRWLAGRRRRTGGRRLPGGRRLAGRRRAATVGGRVLRRQPAGLERRRRR